MAKSNGAGQVITCGKGVDLDSDPINQSPNTRRFTLNGLVGSVDGKKGQLAIDLSNYPTTSLPSGFYIIGDRYIGDDDIVVILTNPTTSRTQIGIIDKSDRYTVHVDTGVLTTKLTNQCDIIYRLRRGNQRVIYWVDAYNNPRSFNIDKPYNYYDSLYASYIRNGGDPATYLGEKWDKTAFDLIKTPSDVPSFDNVEILETGAILPGSYNFAIQLADEDLNPTNWITTSNTVNIFNDTITMNYERIRGSRNIQTDSQNFSRASKTIKLTIGNLDRNYPYYRVAIIRASSNTGEVDKVLLSDLYSTSESTFLYSGNDASLKDGSLEEVMIDKEIIYKPHHIEQLENRCILAYTHGKGIDWCNFQRYASKIKSVLVTKEVLLNNIASDPNVKNAKSTFTYRGYMPGEVYSFGLVYVFKDGYTSPAFHIPGKHVSVGTGDMLYNEIDNVYLNTHNCALNNYWGNDASGQSLTGKKVRHHRFPFRKDVGKPLVTTSTTTVPITRYRLKVKISLNPAYTPAPEYPTTGGNPAVLGITYVFRVMDSTGNSNYSNIITNADMGVDKIAYNDVNELIDVSAGTKVEIDPACEIYPFIYGTNPNFVISYVYDSYVLSSSNDTDVSEIFGIEFSNIEKPHPDVIGFFIVRNERMDGDKMIIDNAIFGPMTQFQQYKSFGLITPKQFYPANNCIGTETPTKTLEYYKRGVWFFNPEFEYYNKKTEFDEVVVEGKYSQSLVTMPTIGENNTSCLTGGAKGVKVQDVQAGTSYNAEINKGEDSDGFDLIIGYRNTDMTYAASSATLPAKKKMVYLNAAASQAEDADVLYNVSIDNKIGMYLTDTDVDIEQLHETATNKNNLLYGSLVKNNTSSYSNFISRPYYKEHNNMVEFGNNTIVQGVKVFNGDAQISAMHFVSSVYYDMVVSSRDKKSKIWQIVAGAVLVAAGVLLSIYGVGIGLAAAGVTLLSSLAVSLGVAIASSGIKFEQMKKMINTDYEKGLKETVTDGGVFETIRENLSTEDDTIRWFSDRVSNIYMESTVAFGLRSGLTAEATDFVDAPKPYDEFTFRDYLVNKMTVIDRDQGSGRLYKGYAGAEVYDMNLDYLRFNKQKIFTHLALEYDCCADSKEVFPLRRWYSEQSFQEERTDNYRAFLPNSYSDMEGEHGWITGMYRLGNNLFMQTREGLWQQPANMQERVTSEIVSFIGTGSFLAIPPRKIVDDNMGSAGTEHKWANIKTQFGVVSVSEIDHKVSLHSDRLSYLSEGMTSYFYDELRSFLSQQLYDNLGEEFMNDNNPANPNGIGYISVYDRRFDRVIITKKDYKILPDKLVDLGVVDSIPFITRSFIISSIPIPPIVLPHAPTVLGFVYCLEDGRFYNDSVPVELSNRDFFEDRSFTISYSFVSRSWVGWHSYMPHYYVRGKNSYYSFMAKTVGNNLYKHNKSNSIITNMFRTYYGKQYPFIVELVLTNLTETGILSDVKLETIAYKLDDGNVQFVVDNDTTFNKLVTYNTRQTTGEQELVPKLKDANYLSSRVVKQSTKIGISKEKRDWYLNEFRDMVINYDETIFTKEWNIIAPNYFIDKMVNPLAIDQGKDWSKLQALRDKYVIFRLKFDKVADVNLAMYFTIPSEQPSI